MPRSYLITFYKKILIKFDFLLFIAYYQNGTNVKEIKVLFFGKLRFYSIIIIYNSYSFRMLKWDLFELKKQFINIFIIIEMGSFETLQFGSYYNKVILIRFFGKLRLSFIILIYKLICYYQYLRNIFHFYLKKSLFFAISKTILLYMKC